MLVTHVNNRESVFMVNVSETNTGVKGVFTIVDEVETNSLKLIRD